MSLRLRKNAKIDLLAGVPLFAGLSKRQLAELAAIADELDFTAGKTIIREGERGREFFVIVDGEAEVRRKGRRLATCRGGEFVGEIALISGVPRVATVTTTAPTRVLVIRDTEFRQLIERMPSIAVKVLEAVAVRLPTAQF